MLISRPDQGATLRRSRADAADERCGPGGDAADPAGQPCALSRALFAGDARRSQGVRALARANKKAAERLRDIAEASAEDQATRRSRAARFLRLASLAGVLLCAVAVAMTARRYVQRHLDRRAAEDARRTRALRADRQPRAAGLHRADRGDPRLAVGFVAQAWLVVALEDCSKASCRRRTGARWASGFLTAIAAAGRLCVAAAAAAVARAGDARAARGHRAAAAALILAYGPAVLAIVLLIFWVVRDDLASSASSAGSRRSCWWSRLPAGLLVEAAGPLRGGVGVSWRYGMANLARRRADSVVQIVAFGHGLMVLLLLAVIRGDLVDDWRAQPAGRRAQLFLRQHPAGRARGIRAVPGRARRAACRACCRWSAAA